MSRICLWALTGLLALPAGAQVQRTFVSSTGLDSNPCSRAAPCRGFAAAVAAVNFGGEVIVLDTAGYGPVTIDKDVSIIAPAGVHAAITATSGDAIKVNAPFSNVLLRGLSLMGKGATNGIDVVAASVIQVDRCMISGFYGPAFRMAAGYALFIDDTVARNNGYGFYIVPPTGTITGSIGHCVVADNTYAGIHVEGTGTRMAVHDTLSVKNGTLGFLAYKAQLDLKGCAAIGNIDGVLSSNEAKVSVSDSLITGNATGLHNDSGTLVSLGNNELDGNDRAKGGTILTISTQ